MFRGDNIIIPLYGVGISYLEVIALPRTLERVLHNTGAVILSPPENQHDYFCYAYYLTEEDWKDAHLVISNNFAITSSIMYTSEISFNDLLSMDDENFW